MASLKSCSSVEFKIRKIFLNFVFFFEESSGIEDLCEHAIFGMILFTFSVISIQIKIFFTKYSISNLHFMQQNEPIAGSY